MALRNLRDILGPLVLPIYDHEYTVPPISAEMGVRLKLAAEGKPDAELDALNEADSYRVFLGEAYDQMAANKVSGDDIERAYITAITDFRSGRAAAEAAWEAGISPEFRAALKAAAEQAAKKARTRSTQSPNTGGAKRTRSAASTKATTSQQAMPRRAPRRPAKGSSGVRSSSS